MEPKIEVCLSRSNHVPGTVFASPIALEAFSGLATRAIVEL